MNIKLFIYLATSEWGGGRIGVGGGRGEGMYSLVFILSNRFDH